MPPPEPLPDPNPYIQIDSPENGSTLVGHVHDPVDAADVTITGMYEIAEGDQLASLTLSLDGAPPVSPSSPAAGRWAWSTRFTASGDHRVEAVIRTKTSRSARTGSGFSVVVEDTRPPVVTITAPADRAVVAKGSVVVLTGAVSDTSVASMSGWVADRYETVTWSGSTWSASPLVRTLGETKVQVTATDAMGNTGSAQITLVATDQTGPELVIDEPLNGAEVPLSVFIRGHARDADSGVAKIEWLDGATWREVNRDGPLGWSFAPTLPTTGPHLFQVRATDGAGNQSTAQITVVGAGQVPRLPDLRDVGSPLNYLSDLIAYFARFVKDGAAPITTARLGALLGLDLQQILDAKTGDPTQDVAELAVVCAALDRDVRARAYPPNPLQADPHLATAYENARIAYLSAAFHALLAAVGTSLDELIRVTPSQVSLATKQAVADRLGVPLERSTDGTTVLNRLGLLPTASFEGTLRYRGEASMAELFGYLAITTNPIPGGLPGPVRPVAAVPAASGLLGVWRARRMHEEWLREDAGADEPEDGLVIDPDLLCDADFAQRDPDQGVYKLWSERQREVGGERIRVLQIHRNVGPWADLESGADVIGLSSVPAHRAAVLAQYPDLHDRIDDAIGLLNAAFDGEENGRDIGALLRYLALDAPALLRLKYEWRPPPDYVVGTEADKEEPLACLVAHLKRRKLAAKWKAAEAAAGLTVDPDLFVRRPLGRVPIPGLYATGVGHDGLATTGPERHWRTEGLATIPIILDSVDGAPGAMPPTATSKWIQPLSSGPQTTELGFSLRGFDPASTQIEIALAATIPADSINLSVGSENITIRGLTLSPQAFRRLPIRGKFEDEFHSIAIQLFPAAGALAAPFRIELTGTAETVPLLCSPYRAAPRRRRAWERKLASRIQQKASLAAGLRAVLDFADAAALPVLRDRLLEALAGADRPSSVVPLLPDPTCPPTTRVSPTLQAADMLCALAQLVVAGPPASSPFASLAHTAPANFAEDFATLGSVASWRGAATMFFYPEAALYPRLNPGTNDFANWCLYLLLNPPAKPDPKAVPAGASAETPTWDPTKFNPFEAGFGASVQAALHLAKQGNFTGALDAFRDVFDERRKEPRLAAALTDSGAVATTTYVRGDRWWTGDALNPHLLARGHRRDAYTRFTITAIARTLLDLGDAQAKQPARGARTEARRRYAAARALLSHPLLTLPAGDAPYTFPPNPVARALTLRAESALARARSGVNLDGLQLAPATGPAPSGLLHLDPDGRLRLVDALPPPPTPYRFAALLQRARDLVTSAQQIEDHYLAALEKLDVESFQLAEAQQRLGLAAAQRSVHDLRVREADGAADLVLARRRRTEVVQEHYEGLRAGGVSEAESRQLAALQESMDLQAGAAGAQFGAAAMTALTAGWPAQWISSAGAGALAGALAQTAGGLSALAGRAQTGASMAATEASYERRARDWTLQARTAQAEIEASEAEWQVATAHADMARAERDVADLEQRHAEATVSFLARKFTGAALYDYMQQVLSGVYRYFLERATAAAHVAEQQLAFEQQTLPLGLIASDYASTVTLDGAAPGAPRKDMRALTGSSRLLRDLASVEQLAFEARRRPLSLTRSFSLARLCPMDLQRLRATGLLPFATPMAWFDEEFPGHYLRLIKSVRVSFAALVPPAAGLAGMLHSSGVSRVVVAEDGFRSVILRRPPESIALSAPLPATPAADDEPTLLRPFEGLGVDTTWLLELPRAANAFDLGTLMDVVFTVEYTALFSPSYRAEVLLTLDRERRAERTFSVRRTFPDAWYDLHNPAQSEQPMLLRFDLTAGDFPPNHVAPAIEAVTVYVIPADGAPAVELPFSGLRFDGLDDHLRLGQAQTSGGIVGTRRGNGAAWRALAGRSPVGTWQLGLPNTREVRALFADGAVQDIFLSVSYVATTPEWPVS